MVAHQLALVADVSWPESWQSVIAESLKRA